MGVSNAAKLFKACVLYFLSKNFFSLNYSSSKTIYYKICYLFHQKSSFHSQDIQYFVIFSYLSTLTRLKTSNGNGIIDAVMNWLA